MTEVRINLHVRVLDSLRLHASKESLSPEAYAEMLLVRAMKETVNISVEYDDSDRAWLVYVNEQGYYACTAAEYTLNPDEASRYTKSAAIALTRAHNKRIGHQHTVRYRRVDQPSVWH